MIIILETKPAVKVKYLVKSSSMRRHRLEQYLSMLDTLREPRPLRIVLQNRRLVRSINDSDSDSTDSTDSTHSSPDPTLTCEYLIVSQNDPISLTECAICLESFKVGHQILKSECTHVYHTQCIIQWRRRSTQCPLCRMPLCRIKGHSNR